jgi:hypothetical protein
MSTATQSEPLTDHGNTVFISHAEKQRIDHFQLASWVGVPLVLVGGVILHFVVGVKLFPNAPTFSEYFSEKTRRKAKSAAYLKCLNENFLWEASRGLKNDVQKASSLTTPPAPSAAK